MIIKVNEGFRIKRAKMEFENRNKSNHRVAIYQHNRMMEVSRCLRLKLKQKPNFSSDDYFEVLRENRLARGRKVYGRTIGSKALKKVGKIKEGKSVENSK